MEQVEVMTPAQWREAVAAHEARVAPHVEPHLGRRKEHRKHPVEDFLFVYYSYSPGKLRRWHPGAGVALLVDERVTVGDPEASPVKVTA